MKIHFDRKVIPNSGNVVIRLIDYGRKMNSDGILLAEKDFSNSKLAFGQIEEVGVKAAEEFGLVKGDYVMFDRLATFYQSEPIVVIEYHNIIYKTNKENSEFRPVKNNVFVKIQEKKDNIDGIYISKDISQMLTGVIIDANVEEDKDFPFSIGDEVLLPKGGDFVYIGNLPIAIFKPEQLICRFEK